MGVNPSLTWRALCGEEIFSRKAIGGRWEMTKKFTLIKILSSEVDFWLTFWTMRVTGTSVLFTATFCTWTQSTFSKFQWEIWWKKTRLFGTRIPKGSSLSRAPTTSHLYPLTTLLSLVLILFSLHCSGDQSGMLIPLIGPKFACGKSWARFSPQKSISLKKGLTSTTYVASAGSTRKPPAMLFGNVSSLDPFGVIFFLMLVLFSFK